MLRKVVTVVMIELMTDSDYIPSPDSEKDSSSDEEDMGADSDNTCPALVDDVIYVPSSN